MNVNSQNNNTFHLKTGDLLFQDLDSSPLCDAIETVTKGFDNLPISHIGIVYINNGQTYIIEAFDKVDTIRLNNFLKRSTYKSKPKVLVGRLKKEYHNLIPQAINRAIELIGKKYDEEFKLNNNKFYCSELIYDIFLYANDNTPFFTLKPMTYKVNGETLDIWLKYFNKLNIEVPENQLGINPGGISLSNNIEIIYNLSNH
jgi:hypothetical protein